MIRQCQIGGKTFLFCFLIDFLTIKICKYLCKYRNLKVSCSRFVSKCATVDDFLGFLKTKGFVVETLNLSNKIFSIPINQAKKKIFVVGDKVILGKISKCEYCKKDFKNKHTCRGDYCKLTNYVLVKTKIPKPYISNKTVFYDIECSTIKDRHYPILICVCCNNAFNSFSTIASFVKYLLLLAFRTRPFGTINVIGFNSSRYDDVFLVEECRKYLSMKWSSKKRNRDYSYIQKQGAIIFNTFSAYHVKIQFNDILRYTGNIVSLRQIASDLKVPLAKGYFPFQVLNLNPPEVDSDGFLAEKYFDSNKAFSETKQIWISLRKCDWFTLLKDYCFRDVIVTKLIWEKLSDMYKRYIPQLSHLDLCQFHGAPSLMKNVALNSIKVENVQVFRGREVKKNLLYAPCLQSYDLWLQSLYGGWVGSHVLGILPKKYNLSMIDIVSHYPTSFTGFFGIGKARNLVPTELVEFKEKLKHYSLNELPIFVADVELKPPNVITEFVSPCPQRNEKGQLIWSYLRKRQILNSVDLWNCVQRGWEIVQIFSGDIFPRKAILFRDYVKTFAKIKDEGAQEKNYTKKMIGKIGLNSCIGKFGERKKREITRFVRDIDDEKHVNDLVTLCPPYCTRIIKAVIPKDNYEEWVIEESDYSTNNVPIHIASIMYAYSRVILRQLIDESNSQKNTDIKKILIPHPIYGDTDSIVTTKNNVTHLREKFPNRFQTTVGLFDTEQQQFDYHVSIETEFISNQSTLAAIFFGLKSYMIVTDVGAKLRCKGHKLSSHSDRCLRHRRFIDFFCPYCLERNRNRSFPNFVNGVTLQHFFNLLTDDSKSFISVTYNRMIKNLQRPQLKGTYPFSVYNVNRSVKLNKPNLNHKYIVKQLTPTLSKCLPFC